MAATSVSSPASPGRKLALACLLSTAFGTGLAAIRVGVAYFPPLTFTMLRLVVVVAVFGVFLGVTRHKPHGERSFIVKLLLVGILSIGIPFISASFALRLISSTLVSIMLNMTPVISVVLAHFFLPDERLVVPTVVGVAVAVLGATLVVWGGAAAPGGGAAATEAGRSAADGPQALWTGVALTLLNTLSLSVSNILLRRWFRNADALTVTGVQLVSGLALVLPLALALDGPPQLTGVAWQGWAALLWAALVGSFVGFLTSFYIILRFGVTAAAISGTGTPLVTALVGVLLLGETLTPLMVLGALLLISGVLVVNRMPRARGGAAADRAIDETSQM